MSIEKLREEFEAALVKREVASLIAKAPGMERESAETIIRSICLERKGDGYAAVVPDYAWWSWKESSASIVVQLPVPSPPVQAWNEYAQAIENGRHSGYKQALRDCKDQIEAMGLKVRP